MYTHLLNINYIIIILISALNIHTCNSERVNSKSEPFTIKLTQVASHINLSNGKVKGNDTSSVDIFSHNNIILYKFNRTLHSTSAVIKGDSVTQFEENKPEIRSQYFVFEKDHNFGILYDDHKRNTTEKIAVDSILSKEYVAHPNIDGFFNRNANHVKLISETLSRNSDELSHVYLIKSKSDSGQKAFCSLYFSKKLLNLDYSLPKELDSSAGRKLYKAFFQFDINHFKYDLEYLLTKSKDFKVSEAMLYINKYKKDFKNLE